MRYIFIIGLLFLAACQKKDNIENQPVNTVSQDSLMRNIQANWKFTVAVTNQQVNAKIAVWEDWRNYTNELR